MKRILLAVLVLALAYAPSALAAASAPSPTTGPAQQVQFDSATVTGTVDPNGSATSYYFEYGTTAAYGLRTSSAQAGAGITAVSVHAALSGLAASTPYHYRLVASSSGGTVVGEDATFTTGKAPAPAAVTRPAEAISGTTAVLEGAVDPEGVATSYYFEYGTGSGYGHATAARSAGAGTSSIDVSEQLSGLSPRTTYHYRLVAQSAGATTTGSDATFITSAGRAPVASTGSVSGLATTSATLAGTVNPEGTATSYYFEYGTTTPSTRTAPATVGAGTKNVSVSVPISGLAPGVRYVYRLVAVGAGTTTGATRSFTTPKTPPSLSLTSTADPVGAGSSPSFIGSLSGTGEGVRTIALEVEPYPYTSGWVQIGTAEQTSSKGTFSFTLANLTANTMVRAVTVGGSPSLTSPTILEKTLVRVSVHIHRHGHSLHIYGLTAPAGAPLSIHIQRRVHNRWVTIARTGAHPIAGGLESYSRTIKHAHRGRYRVVAVVLDGSLLSGRSLALSVG